MKVKIKLRNAASIKNHPIWQVRSELILRRHLVVQPHKKNLKGRIIERIAIWQPRRGRIVRRGMTINKHMARYWLSVGAQPTKGAARILNEFGFYPKYPTPFGSESTYEKPKRAYRYRMYRDYYGKFRHPEIHYKQKLQEEINRVQRMRGVAMEAMDTLGQTEVDLTHVKTDDIDSEEADVFERVKIFEELQKRFSAHRSETHHLKGNDLRFNVYLNKMQKLTRMDIGLDVEGYKEYINNVKEFAKFNHDYDILAKDNIEAKYGPLYGALGIGAERSLQFNLMDEEAHKRLHDARMKEEARKLKITVGKLRRDFFQRVNKNDRALVAAFEENTVGFLDADPELCIDIKRMQMKREKQLKERTKIGKFHMKNVTDKDLVAAGVSKREFEMIKKMYFFDATLFENNLYEKKTPQYFTVDLSKYKDRKIPKDMKEIFYRPRKMMRLYEQYWKVASEIEQAQMKTEHKEKTLRWSRFQHKRLPKAAEDYELVDRVIAAVERGARAAQRELEASAKNLKKMSVNEMITDNMETFTEVMMGQHPEYSSKFFLDDGFEAQEDLIQRQLKKHGVITKKQLEFLFLHNVVKKNKEGYEQMKRDMKNIKIMPSVKHVEEDPLTSEQVLRAEGMEVKGPSDMELFQQKFENFFNIPNPMSDPEVKELLKESAGVDFHDSEDYESDDGSEEGGSSEIELSGEEAEAKEQAAEETKPDLPPLDEKQLFVDGRALYPEEPESESSDDENDYLFHDQALDGYPDKLEEYEPHWDKQKEDEVEFVLQKKEKMRTYGAPLDEMDFDEDSDFSEEESHNAANDAPEVAETNLDDLPAELGLPKEVQHKFSQLYTPQTLKERKELLTWMVDNLRVQLLEYFESNNAFSLMGASGNALIDQINDLHNNMQQELFHITKKEQEGTLLDATNYMLETGDEIKAISDRVAHTDLQLQYLHSVAEHNAFASGLVDKMPTRDLFLDQLNGVKEFHDHLDMLEDDDRIHDIDRHETDNLNVMSFDEGHELLERLEEQYLQGFLTLKDHQALNEMKHIDDIYVTNRNGLNYAKLFLDKDGGYDLDQLTKALKRMAKDQVEGKDPRVPFLEGIAQDEKLKDFLKARLAQNPQEEEEAAASDDENEGPDFKKDYRRMMLEACDTDAEKKLILEMLKLSKETDGETIEPELLIDLTELVSNEEYAKYLDIMKVEHGIHLKDITDRDEFIAAFAEWAEANYPEKRVKRRKRPLHIFEKLDQKFEKEVPEYRHLKHQYSSEHEVPISMVDDEFIPTREGHDREMARIEGNIARYPFGFRHLESFVSYQRENPDATIQDYVEEMNSQATFDDYLKMAKSSFLYEARYNPEIVYEHGLHHEEVDGDMSPEAMAESQEFHAKVMEDYAAEVHSSLQEKEWFKKVDALENFTDLWSIGRGPSFWKPVHEYLPVRGTILPRPKFMNTRDDDKVGFEFTHRTHDRHTPNAGVVDPMTLKPHDPSTMKGGKTLAEEREDMHIERFFKPKKRWSKNRRLSSHNRNSHRSVQHYTKWQFSTTVGPAITEAQEQALIAEFNAKTEEKPVSGFKSWFAGIGFGRMK